jgi:hypothetical protein
LLQRLLALIQLRLPAIEFGCSIVSHPLRLL